MLKRRLKLLGKILLGIVVLFAALLLVERWRGQIALAAYERKLIAAGEKLSPQDFRSVHDDASNGAPAIMAALERLQSGVVLPDNYPPRMQLLVSGRAVVGFRESEWRDGKVTNHWDDLALDLKANEVALTDIRAALAKPVFNNHLDFAQAAKIQFSHLWHCKKLASWFGSAAALALHEQQLPEAAQNLAVVIRLPQLLAEDRVVISELVRIALGAIARADTWAALQADGWTDADLVLLQKAWEAQDFAQGMAVSLEGERVFCSQTARQLRESNDEAYELIFSDMARLAAGIAGDQFEELPRDGGFESLPYGRELLEFGRKQIYCRLWRFSWAHQAELRELKQLQRLIELARRGAQNKSYQSIEGQLGELFAEAEKKSFYDRLRYPGSGTINALAKAPLKGMQMETTRSLALCAVALKRYEVRYGKLPETLAVLVPEFLPVVPVDYLDGQSIKYRLNPDGSFVLYSVGEDGKDDGGDMTLPEGSKSRDLWKRRDYVWPAPATPAEVEEYRRNAGKD
jgi:hypothetical protein